MPQIIKVAKAHKVKIELFSRDQVMHMFIPDGKQKKQAVTEIIAQKFLKQLSAKLPQKQLAAKLNVPVTEILMGSKSAKDPGRPVFNQRCNDFTGAKPSASFAGNWIAWRAIPLTEDPSFGRLNNMGSKS